MSHSGWDCSCRVDLLCINHAPCSQHYDRCQGAWRRVDQDLTLSVGVDSRTHEHVFIDQHISRATFFGRSSLLWSTTQVDVCILLCSLHLHATHTLSVQQPGRVTGERDNMKTSIGPQNTCFIDFLAKSLSTLRASVLPCCSLCFGTVLNRAEVWRGNTCHTDFC